jgi:hypothetical protein
MSAEGTLGAGAEVTKVRFQLYMNINIFVAIYFVIPFDTKPVKLANLFSFFSCISRVKMLE